MIADWALPLNCFLVENVPQDKYDASDWPEILEAMRRTYMEGKLPEQSGQQNEANRCWGRIQQLSVPNPCALTLRRANLLQEIRRDLDDETTTHGVWGRP